MRSKSSHKDHFRFSHFQGKVFGFLLLLFVQNFQAQIYLSGDAVIYSADSVSAMHPNKSSAKIYISSGVKITNLDSEINYEIVEALPLQNKKIESKKNSVLNIAKAELEKKVEEKLVSKPENPAIIHEVFSTPKTDVYFSFVKGFSKITVPVSQFSAKQIINSENYKTSLALGWSKLASVYFKNAELLSAQNKSAFSVRPPPFLA